MKNIIKKLDFICISNNLYLYIENLPKYPNLSFELLIHNKKCFHIATCLFISHEAKLK